MSCPAPAPTLAGFIAWARVEMGITTDQLPDDSVWWGYAFNVAIDVVNLAICQASPTIYMLAVYNLAASNLVEFAQDPVGSEPFKQYNNQPLTFFSYARAVWNINGYVSGTITSASDESTSSSLIVPDYSKNLTLADLQYMKTPYGRQYLAFAQRYGTLWGMD